MKTFFKSSMAIVAIATLGFLSSCDKDEDDEPCPVKQSYSATIDFKHVVDATPLQLNAANSPYTNAMGQKYNITRLRYLVSDITFNKANGESFTINEYHLVDFTDTTTFIFKPNAKVPEGDYSSISYTFGFDKEDNVSGAYGDLNIVNWNWPAMLGGGYHYMQMEGKYLDSTSTEKFFAAHLGTARKMTATDTTFENNEFTTTLANSAINVKSNIEFEMTFNVNEWFKNPTLWDFNVYNAPLMPNYNAQKLMNINGPSVFSVTIK